MKGMPHSGCLTSIIMVDGDVGVSFRARSELSLKRLLIEFFIFLPSQIPHTEPDLRTGQHQT